MIARARTRWASATPTDWPGRADGLTERESDIVDLASQGLTNAEISELLFLSRETVKTHLAKGLRKLGLRNRIEAVRHVAHHWGTARPP